MPALSGYSVCVIVRLNDRPCAFDGPATYRIVVDGLLARDLSGRLQDMSISQGQESERVRSTLTGELQDQAALAGVLSTLYDLHFTLLIVEQVPRDDAGEANGSEANQNPSA